MWGRFVGKSCWLFGRGVSGTCRRGSVVHIQPLEPDQQLNSLHLSSFHVLVYQYMEFVRRLAELTDSVLFPQASHTGMRSYIYKHSSVIGSQAEHGGMRTYYFSADTQEDMNTWLRAMNQAALMQNHTVKRSSDCSDQHCTHVKLEEQAVPQINHINSYVLFHAEAPQSEGTETLKQELLIEEEKSRTAVPEMEEERGKSLPVRPREVELSAPDLAAPSQSTSHPPSRAASTLPASFRNGESQDMNGMVGYQRGPTPRSDTPTHTQGSRSTLEQVENWVKGQKREHKGSVSGEETLSRRTPPAQTSSGTVEAYQSVPNSHQQLPSDYRYAQDRLSQLRAAQGRSPQPATREGTVWQLYEWQQRQQYRHASPTAPIYVPAPDYSTAVSSTRANPDTARSVSVPPLITSAPAPGPPGLRLLSPRRPHTPAERLTVKPQEERPVVEVPPSSSPRRIYSQKYATVERRSIPPSGYITHTVSAPSLHRKTADDTYVQLKKDLEYLDLKVRVLLFFLFSVKLSRLCEQDKTLQELEIKLSTLKEDKDKLESVLDVAHQQMEQYQDQPIHTEKIAYQQRLLQEDLVHIRADISRVATEMERAWAEYGRLEQSVERLREALQTQMNLCTVPQEKSQLKRELWRIEDVMAGLSSTKDAFKITVDSVQNPDFFLVIIEFHTLPSCLTPNMSGVVKNPQICLTQRIGLKKNLQNRPHGSGVKRVCYQSSEGNLWWLSHTYCTMCSDLVSLGLTEKPKSALEQLYSTEPRQLPQRGRMSVEEQLERMKRHQRALVRERKRNINQGERQTSSSRSSSRAVCSDLGPVRYPLPHRHSDLRYAPTVYLVKITVGRSECFSDSKLCFSF
uniref:Pleckstrin homology domain containing, family A member 7a n=1 Tax=Astyanax mexicanus TaxID=7994 RepID=A0A8B9JBZ5_ASTMX